MKTNNSGAGKSVNHKNPPPAGRPDGRQGGFNFLTIGDLEDMGLTRPRPQGGFFFSGERGR